MNSYYYLDVLFSIESENKVPVDIYQLKQIIIKSVKDLFGEAGVGNPVDILKYNQKDGRAILRCFGDFYVKLRSSLSFCSRIVGPTSFDLMSTYRKEGKDLIIFATADDHKEPSKVTLPEPEPPAGLILPNGEINWNCPCLGGMATGPCGVEFRQAFSCFHNSEADPKGSDCYDAFKEMHLCMAEYPQLYNKYNDDDDDDDDIDDKELGINLDSQEKPLLSESNKNDPSDKEKSSNNVKVEEKSEAKPPVHSEPKKGKSAPATGTLKINT